MRQARWRFAFRNLWSFPWDSCCYSINNSITFLSVHFHKDPWGEFGVDSLGITILNFRLGFEKDVPVCDCHPLAREGQSLKN